MKHFVELDVGLSAIVVGWINGCNLSNLCCIPLSLCPLMIGDIELELFHDTLKGRESPDLAHADISQYTMNNIKR